MKRVFSSLCLINFHSDFIFLFRQKGSGLSLYLMGLLPLHPSSRSAGQMVLLPMLPLPALQPGEDKAQISSQTAAISVGAFLSISTQVTKPLLQPASAAHRETSIVLSRES